ncbi:MAG: hypothetical protein V3R79_06615 [Alphaproteobacteria bacterium]
MLRLFSIFSIAALAFLAGLPGAFAAPQILALVETPEPTPLVCAGGVCEAEFSTMCLQKDRDIPLPNIAYQPADAAKIVLVLRDAAGGTRRLAGHPEVRFTVPRTYVSARATIPEAALARLGAVGAAIEIGPLTSLIPIPEPGDTIPLTPKEIAKVTGPLRMAAYRAVKRQKTTIQAARATNRLANAMLAVPAATHEAQNALWEKVVDSMPEGRAAPGIEHAEKIIRTCQSYEEKQGIEGFRGCLQYRHDQLMFGINQTYWNRNDVGS